MNGSKLYSNYFGLFELQNFAINLNFPYETLDEIYNSFDNKNISWADFGNERDYESVIKPFITKIHEDDHLYSLSSTPIGVLLWRCYKILQNDVDWICSKFKEYNVECNPYSNIKEYDTFVKWYNNIGERLLQSSEIEPRLIQYISDFVINEITSVEEFLDILFGNDVVGKYKNYTLKDFIVLLNKVYTFFSYRSSIPFNAVWDTRLDYNTKLFSSEIDFNVKNIIEARGRLLERSFLEINEYSQEFIKAWEEKNVFGVYKKAYDYSLNKFKNPRIAQSVLMDSLQGEIDISIMDDSKVSVFYIEDIFPWFRIKNYQFTKDFYSKRYIEFGRIMNKLDSFKLVNEESRWFDHFIFKNTIETIQNLFYQNLKYTFEHFINQYLANEYETKSMAYIIYESTLFIEYADRLLFLSNNFFKTQKSSFIRVSSFYILNTILTGISLSVLRLNPHESPKPLIDKYIRTLKDDYGTKGSNIEKTVRNTILSKEIIDRFAPIDLRFIPII